MLVFKKKNYLGLIPIALVLLFGIYYIYYCNSFMVELPYLTWFAQIPLADKLLSGTLKVQDLFSVYGEHGMLGNNILYLINVLFFHGSTLFDVYINDINVIVCGMIIALCTWNTLRYSSVYKIIIITAEMLFMFGAMQASSGAMETQVRLGIMFFLVTMAYIDRLLGAKNVNCFQLIVSIILIILSINIFGTLYSFAGIPCVWFIIVFYCLKDKKITKQNLVIGITYFLTIPVYLIEYNVMELIAKNSEGTVIMGKNPILAIMAWYANGALGWAYHESTFYNRYFFLGAGLVILLLTLGAIFLFFFSKMYNCTWLPLMCIAYSFGVFLLVYLGRGEGWDWFSNEWYTVHIKLSHAGMIWIYAYALYKRKRLKYIVGICGLFMLFIGGIGNVLSLKRASSVHDYYQEKQQYLFISNREDMPVDTNGQTPLLDTVDASMRSIIILKKYKLSVYQNADSYEEWIFNRDKEKETAYIDGVYEDGWVEQSFSFVTKTKDKNYIRVSYISYVDQNIEIHINGKTIGEKILSTATSANDEMQYFFIPCESEDTITKVTITSDYADRLSEDDKRIASFVVLDVEGIG